jgi:wyosine [tRNA(Phe)-imidazoG37] synthetase (radical SAM superfamily)
MSLEKNVKKIIDNPKLGKILPISLNPHKVCSFNCIFCDAGPTTRYLMEREMFYQPHEIFNIIKQYIEKNEEPDFLWLSGNGEPSLYLGFKDLCEMIKKIYPEMKIATYSNGSLLHQKDVRECFSLCDRVTINLNSLNPQEYFKISQPHEQVDLKNIIRGLKKFKKIFKGYLGISSVFVKGVNDNENTIENLRSFVTRINPNIYIMIGYFDDEEQRFSDSFKKLIHNKFKRSNFEIEMRF